MPTLPLVAHGHDSHPDHHAHPDEALPGGSVSIEKMPAHWLMARLGKRVLRPGGRELTHWMIDSAHVRTDDDVVELAPGLGETGRALLLRAPRTYVGVERDEGALRLALARLATTAHPDARIVRGNASKVPLEAGAASLVVGEAMLSMQTPALKRAIIGEAARVLRKNGRYAIHELAIDGPRVDEGLLDRVQRDLSKAIHVGVRIGTPGEWRAWLEAEGFVVESVRLAPMRLLEPDRLVQDEGARGAARFVLNTLREPRAARRLLSVRAAFRAHAAHLRGIAIVARRV